MLCGWYLPRMAYQTRTIDAVLDDLMAGVPAISIDGPKGVGKTATAARRAQHSWFLDDPGQAAQLRADPTFQSAPSGTLLIDEWQHHPPIWDSVRRRVDEGSPPGRFLLTGSASPASARGTHSGAGRIISLHMRPMALYERGSANPSVSLAKLFETSPVEGHTNWALPDYAAAMTRGGFPWMLSLPDRYAREQLDSYMARVIDKDIPDLGLRVRRPETLRRWIAAYAAASSTTASYSKILDATTGGDGAQPAKTTAITYRDHLRQLWLIDDVSGWQPVRMSLGQLAQAPKHQLADPALAARALGLSTRSLLSARGAHMIGPLFESLATLSVRVAAQSIGAHVHHLRTRRGEHEIDLIVEDPEGRIVALEVKLAHAVQDKDVRHLLWLREQLPDDVADLVILTTGTTAYRRQDGIAVVPLALLGA